MNSATQQGIQDLRKGLTDMLGPQIDSEGLRTGPITEAVVSILVSRRAQVEALIRKAS